MTDEQQPEKPEQKNKPGKHWILWTVVCTFIVVAIAGMWAIDYFYAPEMLSPDTLPEAVGK